VNEIDLSRVTADELLYMSRPVPFSLFDRRGCEMSGDRGTKSNVADL
jgi:hypothetical protein